MRLRFKLAGSGLAAVLSVALAGSPALAYHQWADAQETSVGSYTGLGVTRVNGTVSVPGASGCTTFDWNSPIYKTEWVMLNASQTDFVEIGTAFQCQGNRFYFNDYGSGGGFFKVWKSAVPSGDTASHDLGLLLSNAQWYSRLDGVNTNIENTQYPQYGVKDQAGFESWDSSITVSSHVYTALKYTTGYGTWINWSGRDGTEYYNPTCGGWDSDTQFHARQNVAPSC